MALDILVVDDERDIRDLVAGVLEDEGYTARTAANSDAALAAIAERRPSLVLLDVWLQGSRLDGLDLLDVLKANDPSLPVLVISGHGSIDTAVAAIRRGAVDFIEKPFEAERLVLLVERATETQRLRRENEVLKARRVRRNKRGSCDAETCRWNREPCADHWSRWCWQGSRGAPPSQLVEPRHRTIRGGKCSSNGA
jgi:two-component system, NtrC family, nitrogen regulation response regulator NtrX